jgi:hypothetical protein
VCAAELIRDFEPLLALRRATGQYGGAPHIAFDARDLPGQRKARHGLHPQLPIQQMGAVQIGVAMQPASEDERSILRTGYHAKRFGLCAVLQRLEADDVEQRCQRIVLA